MAVILKFVFLSVFLLGVSTAPRNVETVENVQITFIGKLKECSDKCSATYEKQLKGFCRPSVNINGCVYTFVNTTGSTEKAEASLNACQGKCFEEYPHDIIINRTIVEKPGPVYCNNKN